MPILDLTTSQVESLVGTRHPVAGFLYPANGLQPYYQWLISTLHLISGVSVGGFKISLDDTNERTIGIASGRATLNGTVLVYAGGVSDLANFNNDTVFIWLYDNQGAAAIGEGASSAGWPIYPHIKLGEVVLSSGLIVDILDRRHETIISRGLETSVGSTLIGYSFNLDVQGNVGSPSTVSITTQDVYGDAIAAIDYLRVRVCDIGGYTVASNATIASGVNTSVVETVDVNKDLILKSHTDGVFLIDVSDPMVETVTLRIGPAPLSSRRGDYSATLDVTHI